MALYHGLPVDELMEWIPAIDNLEARVSLDRIDQMSLATGNLEPSAADRVWGFLAAKITSVKTKRKPRKKGESPF